MDTAASVAPLLFGARESSASHRAAWRREGEKGCFLLFVKAGREVRRVVLKVSMIMTKKAFSYDSFAAFPEGGQPLDPF